MSVLSSHPSTSPFPLQAIRWRQWGFRNVPCVCYLCVRLGYSCISMPARRLATTPAVLVEFPGPHAQADARCLHEKEQRWLDLVLWALLLLYLIFMGWGPRGAKALVAANGYLQGALRASHICCSAECHDPGMQLLLRQLPAGQSNCRCVSFYLFIYVNRVQSLKRLSHAMQSMWQSG